MYISLVIAFAGLGLPTPCPCPRVMNLSVRTHLARRSLAVALFGAVALLTVRKAVGPWGKFYEKMWKTGKPWKIHGNPRKMMYTWYQMVVLPSSFCMFR